jgi:hypothetical protein
MANPSSFLHIQNPRNAPVQSVEVSVLPLRPLGLRSHITFQVPNQTDCDDGVLGVLLQDGHQPESYHSVNGHWAQYCDNVTYQAQDQVPPPSPAAVGRQIGY